MVNKWILSALTALGLSAADAAYAKPDEPDVGTVQPEEKTVEVGCRGGYTDKDNKKVDLNCPGLYLVEDAMCLAQGDRCYNADNSPTTVRQSIKKIPLEKLSPLFEKDGMCYAVRESQSKPQSPVIVSFKVSASGKADTYDCGLPTETPVEEVVSVAAPPETLENKLKITTENVAPFTYGQEKNVVVDVANPQKVSYTCSLDTTKTDFAFLTVKNAEPAGCVVTGTVGAASRQPTVEELTQSYSLTVKVDGPDADKPEQHDSKTYTVQLVAAGAAEEAKTVVVPGGEVAAALQPGPVEQPVATEDLSNLSPEELTVSGIPPESVASQNRWYLGAGARYSAALAHIHPVVEAGYIVKLGDRLSLSFGAEARELGAGAVGFLGDYNQRSSGSTSTSVETTQDRRLITCDNEPCPGFDYRVTMNRVATETTATDRLRDYGGAVAGFGFTVVHKLDFDLDLLAGSRLVLQREANRRNIGTTTDREVSIERNEQVIRHNNLHDGPHSAETGSPQYKPAAEPFLGVALVDRSGIALKVLGEYNTNTSEPGVMATLQYQW